jgi:hypothetical protein
MGRTRPVEFAKDPAGFFVRLNRVPRFFMRRYNAAMLAAHYYLPGPLVVLLVILVLWFALRKRPPRIRA